MTDKFDMVALPLEEGEKLQRRVRIYYLKLYDEKEQVRDFNVIPLLKAYTQHTDLKDIIFAHLDEAANENLSTVARNQHFDIAGSIIWQTVKGQNSVTAKALTLFMSAGGI
jgi:hypothetical protein